MTELDKLEIAAGNERAARYAAAAAREQLREAVVATIRAGEVTEARAARLADVDRMTVRRWMGKDRAGT